MTTGGAGDRRGRPAHKPTAESRKHVKGMSACGVPEDDIALIVGVDPKTLRKHYAAELGAGKVAANAKVQQSLFRKATGNTPQAVIAAIFWLKTQAGWKEPGAGEQPGKKEQRKDAAEKVASTGRFAPARPPLKLVKGG